MSAVKSSSDKGEKFFQIFETHHHTLTDLRVCDGFGGVLHRGTATLSIYEYRNTIVRVRVIDKIYPFRPGKEYVLCFQDPDIDKSRTITGVCLRTAFNFTAFRGRLQDENDFLRPCPDAAGTPDRRQ